MNANECVLFDRIINLRNIWNHLIVRLLIAWFASLLNRKFASVGAILVEDQ